MNLWPNLKMMVFIIKIIPISGLSWKSDDLAKLGQYSQWQHGTFNFLAPLLSGSRPEIELMSPAVEVQSPNCWTTTNSLTGTFKQVFSVCHSPPPLPILPLPSAHSMLPACPYDVGKIRLLWTRNLRMGLYLTLGEYFKHPNPTQYISFTTRRYLLPASINIL